MVSSREVQDSAGTDLIDACRQGDRNAFQSLFELYSDRVYSFALRFLGDEAQAADVAQEIFIKLFDQIRSFHGESKFETWLYRVVSNACIDDQRKRRRFLPWVHDHHPSQISGRHIQEDRVAREQTSQAIHAAVAKLTPALRVPILLRYMQGLSYEEISEVLQISAGTVASRLNRGHRVLAQKLERFRGMTK